MASRAESGGSGSATIAAAGTASSSGPSLGGSVRLALSDAYYHSWRLLPANVVWGVTVVVVATAAVIAPIAIILLPVLAVPTAGIFRVTTRIVRGEAVSFWDAVDAWRSDVATSLALGAAGLLGLLVLGINAGVGLAGGSPMGWGLATLAIWGLVAGWAYAWTAWPILLDPRRASRSVRERLELAGLLLLAHPVRIGALALAIALFLAASTVSVVALVTISVSIAALVATRLVLPAADRLELRLGRRSV